MAFYGNPHVLISGVINLGSGILTSRDPLTGDRARLFCISRSTGAKHGEDYFGSPAFIQVSAADDIVVTGTDRPWEDLEFTWDFGDPTGTEVLISPFDGRQVNQNWQRGPIAVYPYREPGSYTITLTARGVSAVDVDGNPTDYITATATKNITVEDFETAAGVNFSGTWYYDQNATGANNGTSPTDAFTLVENSASVYGSSPPVGHVEGETKWNETGDNLFSKTSLDWVDIRIACGSSWSATEEFAMVHLLGDHIRVSTYVPASGSTEKPSFLNSRASPISSKNMTLRIATGNASGDIDDVTISNVYCIGERMDSVVHLDIANKRVSQVSNIYLDSCKTQGNSFQNALAPAFDNSAGNVLNMAAVQSNNQPGQAFIAGGRWNCETISTTTLVAALAGDNKVTMIDAYGPEGWSFWQGGRISGIAGDSNRDHVLNNEQQHYYQSIKYVTISGASGGGVINGNARGVINGTDPYYYIAECDISTDGSPTFGDTYTGGPDFSNTLTVDDGRIYTITDITVGAPVGNPPVRAVTVTVAEDLFGFDPEGSTNSSAFFGITPNTFNGTFVILASLSDVPNKKVGFNMVNYDPGTYISGGNFGNGLFRFCLVENCRIHINGQASTLLLGQVKELTVRNNLFYGCKNYNLCAPNPLLKTIFSAQYYGNYIYIPQSAKNSPVFYFQGPPGWTGTQKQLIRNNVIVDMRNLNNASMLWQGAFKELGDNNAIDIDKNTYWFPNYTNAFSSTVDESASGGPSLGFKDSNIFKAYIDKNSNFNTVNPSWTDPANGVFDVPANRVKINIKHV